MDNTILGKGFLMVWIDKKPVKLTNENIKQAKVEDIFFKFFVESEALGEVKNLVSNEYNGNVTNQMFLTTQRIKAENIKNEYSPTYLLVEDIREAEFRKTKSNLNSF